MPRNYLLGRDNYVCIRGELLSTQFQISNQKLTNAKPRISLHCSEKQFSVSLYSDTMYSRGGGVRHTLLRGAARLIVEDPIANCHVLLLSLLEALTLLVTQTPIRAPFLQ